MGTHVAMASDIYGWSVVEGRGGEGPRVPLPIPIRSLLPLRSASPRFLPFYPLYKKHQTGVLDLPRIGVGFAAMPAMF